MPFTQAALAELDPFSPLRDKVEITPPDQNIPQSQSDSNRIEISTSAADDEFNIGLVSLCSPLPLSVFTIAVIFHWRKHLPRGLLPRHVYLSDSRLRYWKDLEQCSTPTQLQILSVRVPVQEVCASMTEAIKMIYMYHGDTAASAIRLLVSNAKWKNIFVDPRSLEDDPEIKVSMKQAKRSMRACRDELQNLTPSMTNMLSSDSQSIEVDSGNLALRRKSRSTKPEILDELIRASKKRSKKAKPEEKAEKKIYFDALYDRQELNKTMVTSRLIVDTMIKMLNFFGVEPDSDSDIPALGVKLSYRLTRCSAHTLLDFIASDEKSEPEESDFGKQLER